MNACILKLNSDNIKRDIPIGQLRIRLRKFCHEGVELYNVGGLSFASMIMIGRTRAKRRDTGMMSRKGFDGLQRPSGIQWEPSTSLSHLVGSL